MYGLKNKLMRLRSWVVFCVELAAEGLGGSVEESSVEESSVEESSVEKGSVEKGSERRTETGTNGSVMLSARRYIHATSHIFLGSDEGGLCISSPSPLIY